MLIFVNIFELVFIKKLYIYFLINDDNILLYTPCYSKNYNTCINISFVDKPSYNFSFLVKQFFMNSSLIKIDIIILYKLF
jgi:hypothetical protein